MSNRPSRCCEGGGRGGGGRQGTAKPGRTPVPAEEGHLATKVLDRFPASGPVQTVAVRLLHGLRFGEESVEQVVRPRVESVIPAVLSAVNLNLGTVGVSRVRTFILYVRGLARGRKADGRSCCRGGDLCVIWKQLKCRFLVLDCWRPWLPQRTMSNVVLDGPRTAWTSPFVAASLMGAYYRRYT